MTDKTEAGLAPPIELHKTEGEEADVSALIEATWNEILNYDDRNSPEEYPEMVLLSHDEFAGYMRRAALLSSQAATRAEVIEECARVADAFGERASEEERTASDYTRQSCINRHASGISIAAQIRALGRSLSPTKEG